MTRRETILRRACAGGAAGLMVAWAVWLWWLPIRLADGPVSGTAAAMAALTYQVGGVVCHQDPVRSFAAGSWAMPVCARCFGLYAGAAVGAAVGCVAAWRRSRWSVGPLRWALAVGAAPTAVLWLAEWIGGQPVGNLLRMEGALPCGAVVAAVLVRAIGGGIPSDRTPLDTVH